MRDSCCAWRVKWRDTLPRTFACACELRTGVFVIAAVSGVYALLLVAAPLTLGVCGQRMCRQLDTGLIGQLVAWIAAALLALSAILLAVGAFKGRRELLVPWLGFSSVYVVLWIMAAVIFFIVIAVQQAFAMAAAAFFISLNMAVLPLYFLLVVTALYVRIGQESREAAERALGGFTPPPADALANAPDGAAAASTPPAAPRGDGRGPAL
ncbi:hypothetical protein R5R35_009775 [Gryllus longicercus]|uniref:Uncharacterized protein n=1 Tax=Gryllus longicercus TaxID=2509291 RepID=A0AAN9ZA35_9ORTH